MNCFFRHIALSLILLTAGLQSGLAQVMTARDWFMKGSAQYRCHACGPAVESFSKAIALNDKYVNAFMGRGLSYLCLNNLEGANGDIRKAMTLNPDEPLYVHAFGRIKEARGDLKGALIEYTKATEMDPNCWQAWFSKGQVLVRLNESDKAVSDLDNALSANPDCGVCWLEKGKAKMKAREWNDAVSFLTVAEEKLPGVGEVPYLRGNGLEQMNKYAEAAQEYGKAIELDKKQADWYLARGRMFYALRIPENATADFEACLKIDHRNGEAWMYKAKMLRDAGDIDKALKLYTKSLKLNPALMVSYMDRAGIFLTQEKKEKALADLTQAVNIDPLNLDLRQKVGIMRIDLGDLTGALAEFRYILRKDPNYAAATFGLGQAFIRLGKKKEACDQFTEAWGKGYQPAADALSKFCTQ